MNIKFVLSSLCVCILTTVSAHGVEVSEGKSGADNELDASANLTLSSGRAATINASLGYGRRVSEAFELTLHSSCLTYSSPSAHHDINVLAGPTLNWGMTEGNLDNAWYSLLLAGIYQSTTAYEDVWTGNRSNTGLSLAWALGKRVRLLSAVSWKPEIGATYDAVYNAKLELRAVPFQLSVLF
jgi:hypothetical protein